MGLSDLSSEAQIGIGVIVGILSTSIQSLGLTLQRKSHILEDDRALLHLAKRPPHRRRRWQIGMLLFIISNILGSTIQITTLPLVILSPLQASGLVFNSICATLILSEPFTRYSLVGTILVCIGATLIAAFGALKEPAHTLDELLELLGKKPFLLWMGCQVVLVSGILAAAKASRRVSPRTKNTMKIRMTRGIAYGCVSGILSAHCLLLAKSAVELLVRTIVDRANQFGRWQSWVILIGLVTFALTQLFYLHRGLKLVSTSVLYPLVFCVYNIIAILDGLLYYRQTSRLSPFHGGLIALGTVILLSGVLALSWRLQDEKSARGEEASKVSNKSTPGGIGFVELDTDEDDESYHDDIAPPPAPSFLGREMQSVITKTGVSRPPGRRRTLSQAEEIWGELQDHDSTISPRANWAAIADENDVEADESTGLLLHQKLSSGRRKAGRRVSNYRFPRSLGGGNLKKTLTAQDATGGWWNLRWWKHKNGVDEGDSEHEGFLSHGLES